MEDNFVTLYNEDGDAVKLEVLGVVKHDGENYVVLTACDDDDELEPVTILHLAGTIEDGQELFEPVEWNMLLKIWGIFRTQNADRFEFLDD